jgi:hypothetical protein
MYVFYICVYRFIITNLNIDIKTSAKTSTKLGRMEYMTSERPRRLAVKNDKRERTELSDSERDEIHHICRITAVSGNIVDRLEQLQ